MFVTTCSNCLGDGYLFMYGVESQMCKTCNGTGKINIMPKVLESQDNLSDYDDSRYDNGRGIYIGKPFIPTFQLDRQTVEDLVGILDTIEYAYYDDKCPICDHENFVYEGETIHYTECKLKNALRKLKEMF